MTLALHGIGVSRGIAIGTASILQRDEFEINEYSLPKEYIADEIIRYRTAINIAKENLREVREQISKTTPSDIAAFIDAHLLMLYDATLSIVPIEIIETKHCNAEWALKIQRDNLVAVFNKMEDPYLRARSEDIEHVVNTILSILIHNKMTTASIAELGSKQYNKILIAYDLTPADTVLIQQQGYAGFIIETGGTTSHTAILARSLKIPAIVGMSNARKLVQEGETIIIDAINGVLVTADEKSQILFYQKKQQQEQHYSIKLKIGKQKPCKTSDGTAITLRANIELPSDIPGINEYAAEGVGLYRTEFLFMNRPTPPDEQEQYDVFYTIARELNGKPLTIRTLDLGADKQVDGARKDAPVTTNPALGLRAIRLCIKEPQLFIPQIRAILRLSSEFPVRIMLPMISNVHELDQAKQMINDAKSSLARENCKFDKNIKIGGMIEVPAAALSAEMFARKLDFLSIGTNDLIQYTLAVDRIDDTVNYLYDPINPSVLQLIRMTIKAGLRCHKPVAMCGEMAGDIRYTCLLLGMGLTEFSMHPSALPEIKFLIQKCNLPEIQNKIKHLFECDSFEQFHNILDQLPDSHL